MTASLPSEVAVLSELKCVFPEHNLSLLKAIAKQHNFNLELAVANVLAGEDDSEKPIKVPHLQQPKDWLRKGKPKGGGAGGWHALTAKTSGKPAAEQPRYRAASAPNVERPRHDDSGEFPSLDGTSRKGNEATPPAQSNSTPHGDKGGAGRPASAGAFGGRAALGGGGRAGRRSRQTSGGPSADTEDAAALSRDFVRVVGRSDSAKRDAEDAARERWQLGEAEVASLHPWAGHDLVQAVLAGVGGDKPAAAQVLEEMCTARLHQQRRSSDSGARRSGDSGVAASPPMLHAPVRHTPDAALQAADGSAGGNDGAARPERWPKGHLAEPADDHELAADLAEEPYRHHRSEAIRLTHTWQRGMHRAAAAFAVGDKAAASRIAQAARRKREEALAAHEAAAAKILRENNAGKGRGAAELDLHGLHTSEAVAALDAHLRGLEEAGAEGAGVDRVRAIVGRGRHSSAGEASLPRAVESYLLDSGRRFTAKRGAFEVAVRRGAARPGATGAAR